MTREQKVAKAQRLRNDGLSLREIAEQMDVAKSTVSQYLTDPDLSKLKARKDSYRGVCQDCGGQTDGSGGKDQAPERCLECTRNLNTERNELLREMWEADEPTWYIAQKMGMTEAAVHSWVFSRRHEQGEDLSLRRLGGDRAAVESRRRRMIALRREGYSNGEIAGIVGMASAACVSQAFTQMRSGGWAVPAPRGGHRQKVVA